MFKDNNKNTRATSLRSFWCFFLSNLNITPFSGVSIAEFEQVYVSWIGLNNSLTLQRRIQNPVKHLRWSVLQT